MTFHHSAVCFALAWGPTGSREPSKNHFVSRRSTDAPAPPEITNRSLCQVGSARPSDAPRLTTSCPLLGGSATRRSAPDLNPDRRAEEAELFAELIDEKTFVRKVKRRGHVGKEDERRRRNADLR